MKKLLLNLTFFALVLSCGATENPIKNAPKTIENTASYGYWQQHVNYTMEIDMDVKSYQYNGKQKLVLKNSTKFAITRMNAELIFSIQQISTELTPISDPH